MKNNLGTQPINKLLRNFAIPSIIAMLVSALYNIVDQFFIGRSVGELGNAATNITFPLTTSCIALALLLGIGAASAFNLTLGEGKKEKALYYIGNSALLLFLSGVVLCIIIQIFLEPMLRFFGSPDNVLVYAKNYTRVTAIGFPFLIFSTGGGHLIRADGSPKYSMLCNLSGAIINIILDPIFIFGFNMGMVGAGLATIIGQIFAAFLVLRYLLKYKTGKIEKKHLIPKWNFVSKIISLGAAPCFNQLAMMIVQIVMNKSLTYYGALSVYGESIPLACAGIITKVNQIYMSIVIGLSQGLQPIVSFNYGAKLYDRVKKAFKLLFISCFTFTMVTVGLIELFPAFFVKIFNNSPALVDMTSWSMRIYFAGMCLFGMQISCQQTFLSLGEAKISLFLALLRKMILLVPLIFILPAFMKDGLTAVLLAEPVADVIACLTTTTLFYRFFKKKFSGDNIVEINENIAK